MARRDDRAATLGSRAVQVGFLLGILGLWYLATNRWGVNRLLLPNPVAVWQQLLDVLKSGEYLPDLRITLTELFAAFALSMSLWHHRRLFRQPHALYDPRLRSAVRRHLFDPDHSVFAALCAVLRAGPGIEDRARRHHQLLSHRALDHRRLRQCRSHAWSPRPNRWALRTIKCSATCCCRQRCR